MVWFFCSTSRTKLSTKETCLPPNPDVNINICQGSDQHTISGWKKLLKVKTPRAGLSQPSIWLSTERETDFFQRGYGGVWNWYLQIQTASYITYSVKWLKPLHGHTQGLLPNRQNHKSSSNNPLESNLPPSILLHHSSSQAILRNLKVTGFNPWFTLTQWGWKLCHKGSHILMRVTAVTLIGQFTD